MRFQYGCDSIRHRINKGATDIDWHIFADLQKHLEIVVLIGGIEKGPQTFGKCKPTNVLLDLGQGSSLDSGGQGYLYVPGNFVLCGDYGPRGFILLKNKGPSAGSQRRPNQVQIMNDFLLVLDGRQISRESPERERPLYPWPDRHEFVAVHPKHSLLLKRLSFHCVYIGLALSTGPAHLPWYYFSFLVLHYIFLSLAVRMFISLTL